VKSCSESAETMFKTLDRNGDGILADEERESIDASASKRAGMDLNKDESVEYREYLQFKCTCEVELETVFDGFSEGRDEVTLASLRSHAWANEYNFDLYNANGDSALDRDEFDLLVLMCETTFDAFDGDGDGVPDKDDAFPDDPTETKDTDGDGVGDNADIVASVSNDIVYATAGTVLVVLLGVLVLFLRNGSGGQEPDTKEWSDETRLHDSLFGQPPAPLTSELPSGTVDGEPSSAYSTASMEEFFAAKPAPSITPDAPNQALMGMMVDGVETVEHPTGSGTFWIRHHPESSWEAKTP
jgi:hypothetical protein